MPSIGGFKLPLALAIASAGHCAAGDIAAAPPLAPHAHWAGAGPTGEVWTSPALPLKRRLLRRGSDRKGPKRASRACIATGSSDVLGQTHRRLSPPQVAQETGVQRKLHGGAKS